MLNLSASFLYPLIQQKRENVWNTKMNIGLHSIQIIGRNFAWKLAYK